MSINTEGSTPADVEEVGEAPEAAAAPAPEDAVAAEDPTEDAEQPPKSEAPGEPPVQPPSGPAFADRPRGKGTLSGIAIAVVALLVLGVGGVWIAYASTDLPTMLPLAQTTRIEYADGTTFATFATENRTEVRLSQVPNFVQSEVVAAEEPGFWSSETSAVGATARSIWGLVGGRKPTNASITEQYLQASASLSRDRRGRAKAAILAHKLGKNMSKPEILLGYLNTIYFGRSAWGIEAGAQAYFNKDVSELTPAEGAVLAALIKDPAHLDPTTNPAGAKARWNDVMAAMVKHKFMSSTDRAQQTFPVTSLAPHGPYLNAWRTGATGVLGYRIEQELKKIRLTEQDLNTGGLIVRTTISSSSQAAAVAASRTAVNAKVQDPRMGTATVSIDPSTGAVKAYYGGDAGYGGTDLAAARYAHPAGPTFGPYVLAGALAKGYPYDSVWNGRSGQSLPGRRTPLANDGNDSSCGPRCSLTAATVKSVNTVFWAVTDAVGYNVVARTANAAGIQRLNGLPVSTQINKGGLGDSISIGNYSVSVLDQATGYATMANYGTYRQPYFVSQILNPDGSVVYDHGTHIPAPVHAWSRDVGRDLTYVLEQVSNANRGLALGRRAALKPGAQQYQKTNENSDAWLAGYTPQLATAVWVGSKTKTSFALRDKAHGNIRVSGTGIPGSIWRQYMLTALKSQAVANFLPPLHGGTLKGNAQS